MKIKNIKSSRPSKKGNNEESGGEIPEVPPTEASMNDLENFEDFIEKHSEHFKKYGVMKIIPPSNWNPIMENFDFVNDESETFEVSFYDLLKSKPHDHRYYIYESAKRKNKFMTIRQYYKQAKLIENKFSHLSIKEKEKIILDGNFANIMYATDVDFPVIQPSYSPLNLHNIPNLLDNYVERYGHASGITSPLSYIGAMGSRFGWHVEDMNLFSISVLLFGEPKIWYTIPANQGTDFEELQKKYNEWPSLQCSRPLRHRNNCFDPSFVRSCGINVYKTIHKPMEIVVTAPGAFHSGMNLGYNVAVAMNFAFNQWIPHGKEFTTCDCHKDVDKFMCNVDDIAISHVKPASLPLKKRSLKCEECNKSMLSVSALNYHKKQHTPIKFSNAQAAKEIDTSSISKI